MRILQVNKFLYRRAGAEAYVLDLVELLMEHGHEVTLWGTDQISPPLPLPPPLTPPRAGGEIAAFSPPLGGGVRGGAGELLVRHLNFDQREGLWRDLKKFGHMIWSAESARKFEQVVREFKPDIVHIHNIYHHLSPSILPVAARYKVPVVMTVHDWHLINPNYNLFDHGEICERQGLRAITHRCIKNSFAASLADVLEWRVHQWMRVYEKYVMKFIVPNEFVKGKLMEHGMDVRKIEVIPLPVAHNPSQPPLIFRGGDDLNPPLKVRGGRGSYVLFSGRLTVEKGIYVLLEMAKQLPEIKFKIAGGGSEQANIQYLISNFQLSNVELLGFQKKVALEKIIAGARMVVVPSLWEELSPLSVLEAMAQDKVVVASRIGGISELIKEGKTGFLVEPPTPPPPTSGGGLRRGEWIDTIRKLYYDEPLLKKVGRVAAEYVKRVHNPEKHYEKIMEIYRAVCPGS